MKLTPDQLTELGHLQQRHGPSWRATLRGLWDSGKDEKHPVVRQLRNDFGPDWLNAYRIGDTQVGWLAAAEMEVGTGAPGYRWAPCWKIVDTDGVDLVQPYSRTKAEVRRMAHELKITLIED